MHDEIEGNTLKVAYLGPATSFTHQAALQLFPVSASTTQTRLIPYPNFSSIFSAVSSGVADRGIIPIQNSTNGPVVENIDLLASAACEGKESRLRASGETYVGVQFCLAGRKKGWKSKQTQESQPHQTNSSNEGQSSGSQDLSHITCLRTHPQAWTQCTEFLDANFAHISHINHDSTSAAAESVAADESGTSAAICSALTANYWGLEVLVDGIQTDSQNETRFLLLHQQESRNSCDPNMDLSNGTTEMVRKGMLAVQLRERKDLEKLQGLLRRQSLEVISLHSRSRDGENLLVFLLEVEGKGDIESEAPSKEIQNLVVGWWDWGRWNGEKKLQISN